MRVALAVRVAPLVGLEEMNQSGLIDKASQFWKRIVKLETEKYDLEMRMNRQDYDIRELRERQKQQLRQKALRRVLTQRLLPASTHLRSRLLPNLRGDQTAGHTMIRRNSLRAVENWKSRMNSRNSGNSIKLSSKADRRSVFPSGSVSAQARRRVKPIPMVRRKKKK